MTIVLRKCWTDYRDCERESEHFHFHRSAWVCLADGTLGNAPIAGERYPVIVRQVREAVAAAKPLTRPECAGDDYPLMPLAKRTPSEEKNASMVDMTTNALSIPGHRYVPGRGLNAWAFRYPNTLRRRAGLRKKQAVHQRTVD
jgi:hypothetical protein